VPFGLGRTATGLGRLENASPLLFAQCRFFRAALAPSFPRAVRVFFAKFATVLFNLAAVAAFLMFRFAAARCFLVVMFFAGSLLLVSASHLSPCHHLGVKFDRSYMTNRLMREIRSLVQLLLVAQADLAERQIRRFRLPLPETLME
jgi:hypothetical protein